MKPKVLVMSGYGINCEEETKHAFELVGAQADIVHINDLISKKKNMNDYDLIVFPGGFSYGDDTFSGNAFANRIKNNLWEDLMKFIESEKLILGICNGFQVMTNLGLFPTPGKEYGEVITSLLANSSDIYQCRWINIKTNSKKCVFTNGVDNTHIPIAHGEGRFYTDLKTLDDLKNNDQIVFIYVNEDGSGADGIFPQNPNGAVADVAAICDKSGRIMGMMPHPERALYKVSEPEYQLKKELTKREGKELGKFLDSNLQIFKNAIMHLQK